MYIRFLFDIGGCIPWVSFWEYLLHITFDCFGVSSGGERPDADWRMPKRGLIGHQPPWGSSGGGLSRDVSTGAHGPGTNPLKDLNFLT